ncbi:MAG: pilus assembly protein PilM [bacterium]|nr:pilus assembly protein PilM [bacterium]
MSLFSFKSKSKIGVDIGTASIKIVELTKEGGRFKLGNYSLFELESDDRVAIKQERRSDKIVQLSDGDIVWGIKEALKRARINTKDVVASIPSFLTFATVVKMPFIPEKDVAQTIKFEARKYIPLPLNEVVLDWSILNIATDKKKEPEEKKGDEDESEETKKSKPLSEETGQPTSLEVFLAAVPKDETVRYQSIMKRAGLTLRALELENSALTRAIVGNDLSPVAIINIGGRSTSILIVDKGIERISHNYEVGGFEITKSIAESLKIGLKRAEELKRSFGLRQEENNVISKAMSSLIDRMGFEANRTISGYELKHGTKIGKVILVGGLVNMPNFVAYFKQKMGREVAIGNPMARVSAPPEIEKINAELNSTFAIAIGLAMRNI